LKKACAALLHTLENYYRRILYFYCGLCCDFVWQSLSVFHR